MKTFFLALGLITCSVSFGQYNFYFGNIHSHSAYSDGNMDEATSGRSTPSARVRGTRNEIEHNHHNALVCHECGQQDK